MGVSCGLLPNISSLCVIGSKTVFTNHGSGIGTEPGRFREHSSPCYSVLFHFNLFLGPPSRFWFSWVICFFGCFCLCFFMYLGKSHLTIYLIWKGKIVESFSHSPYRKRAVFAICTCFVKRKLPL